MSLDSEKESNIDGNIDDNDVTLKFIGDIHFVLGVEEFREDLDSSDVIFIEYPDDRLDNSLFDRIKFGFRSAYEMGGLLFVIATILKMMERQLFGRNTLAWRVLHKYNEKIAGIDTSEGRSQYMKEFGSDGKFGLKQFFLTIFLLVLTPRSILINILEKISIKQGEKSTEGEVYITELLGQKDSKTNSGNDQREEYMADSVEEYLDDHPEVSEAVVIVGALHLDSVIRQVDEKDGEYTLEILNDNLVSEYLKNR